MSNDFGFLCALVLMFGVGILVNRLWRTMWSHPVMVVMIPKNALSELGELELRKEIEKAGYQPVMVVTSPNAGIPSSVQVFK